MSANLLESPSAGRTPNIESAPETASGVVFDIRRFSVHDGPGLRTTVFFKGCPLRCMWCHNPESQHRRLERMYWPERCLGCQSCVAACPQGAIRWDGQRPVTDEGQCNLSGACVEVCYAEAQQIVGRSMIVAQVMAEIERDRTFYEQSGGGVTFSGGEPLLQSDFLLALLIACRKAEIHTALDTSGFASWAILNRIRPYVDLFLFDLKLMDANKHRKFTLVSNKRILENLEALVAHSHKIVIRVPIIPGINDDEENLRALGAYISGLDGVNEIDLLPYHPAATGKYERLHRSYRLPDLKSPTEERMTEIASFLSGFGLQVNIGG